VTFTAQEAAPLPPRLSRRLPRRVVVGLAVLAVSLSAAAAVGVERYRAAHDSTQPTYSADDLAALAALKLPADFRRVPSSWGCVTDTQDACFNTSMSPVRAAQAVATAVGVRQYTTVFSDGVATIRPHYTVCTTVGSTPALAMVAARPSNAVKQGTWWVVPDGQTPHYRGTVVVVYLTGPGSCVQSP
jgi:hypothetical protein